MSFGNIKRAAFLRPMLQLGSLFDMMTGTFYKGKDGQYHLNGGLPNFVGVAGLPNTFKTHLALFFVATIMARYSCSRAWPHDAENTLTIQRVMAAMSWYAELAGVDLEELGRFVFTDADVYKGDEWFVALKKESEDRKKDKSLLRTTPFWDHKHGGYVQIPAPTVSLLDSLSGMTTNILLDKYDEHGIGESKLNSIAMDTARIKSQMLEQMINVTSPGGIFSIMTAHIGQEYTMDAKKQPIKRLKHLKGDLKLKKTSENFAFYTGICWQCVDTRKMLDGDRMPEFPRSKEDAMKDDTDLLEVPLVGLRNKSGPSGVQFSCVMSQSEGVKMGLTEYLFLKSFRKPDADSVYYGIGGNDSNYFLHLHPDEKLTRKSIRRKLDDDKLLARAMSLTAQLAYMRMMWHNLEEGFLCTPKQLREDLTAKGYDWNILLNTREFWIFQEDSHPQEEMTVIDLLNMRKGRYHPKWYPKSLKEMNLPDLEPDPYLMISGTSIEAF